MLIKATCFQNLLDFSFGKIRKLSLLPTKFSFEPYYYKFNSIFKQQTFPNMKLTKKMRNTILNNYWYKETIKILIDSMNFQGYKTSTLISSPILTRCCSYFSTIKQLKYKTPEWQWHFTLEAIGRNLIVFAFLSSLYQIHYHKI